MADPRGFTLKTCRQKEPSRVADRRAFGNAVGKVGDLEILNTTTAGSNIGQGLRTLSSISNSIRTGCGALPSIIGTSLDTGANWVLEQTGIAPTVVDALSNFEPGIANQAWGQAKQIYEQVSQGNFKLTDIPYALQDLQNLERLGRNIFYPSTTEQRTVAVCEGISPYAIDLILRAPKYKFLFVVQVTFNEAYTGMGALDFAFVIKNTTRPNLKYQMSDINYYNFRTKHVTRTEFDEMKMSFHEDTGTGKSGTTSALSRSEGEQGNNALRFYNTYMRATVPITNYSEHIELSLAEQQGMDFAAMNSPVNTDANTRAYKYAASSGPLMSNRANSDPRNIIREVRLFHVYNYGKSMNVYKFFNPRITSLSLDDLDMSNSTEGTEVSMAFNFDSVYIDTGVPMDSTKYNLAQLQGGATYPLRYNATTGGTPLPDRNIAPFGTPSNGTGNSCDPSINTKLPPADDTSFI
jgi:hypothetical protein